MDEIKNLIFIDSSLKDFSSLKKILALVVEFIVSLVISGVFIIYGFIFS